MNLPAKSVEIDKAVMKAGNESLELIQLYLSKRISKEELLSGLSRFNVEEIITENWEELTTDARYVPHWEVLQALQGIIEELEFQVGEYGESTLYDDFKDIAFNLKRISESAPAGDK